MVSASNDPSPATRQNIDASHAESLPEIDLFTDGACIGNPETAWRVGIQPRDDRQPRVEKEMHDGLAGTTNNRMEMLAIIEGLSALKAAVAALTHP